MGLHEIAILGSVLHLLSYSFSEIECLSRLPILKQNLEICLAVSVSLY